MHCKLNYSVYAKKTYKIVSSIEIKLHFDLELHI
jgi:hypothetical protein